MAFFFGVCLSLNNSIKPVLVAGLGNPLAGDEGIGIALVEKLSALAEQGKLPSDAVEYLDAGTGGMRLLHKLDGRKKLILIDCAKMGQKPGTIRRFSPEDVKSVKQLAGLSLHEMDILKLLDLGEQLGHRPAEVVIFGIEPACLELNPHLSAELSARFDSYIEVITSEIC